MAEENSNNHQHHHDGYSRHHSSSPTPSAQLNAAFDELRTVRTLLASSSTLTIPIRLLNAELTCAVCLSIMRDCTSVCQCLHRFCAVCIEKSIRLGKKECPQCRVPCPSRRHLRPDPIFDAIINIIYPDREKAESQQDKMIMKIIESTNVSKFAESALKGAQRQAEKAKERTILTKRQIEEQQARSFRREIYDEDNISMKRDENYISIILQQHPNLAAHPILGEKYRLPKKDIAAVKQLNIFLIKKFLQIIFTTKPTIATTTTTPATTKATTEETKSINETESIREESENAPLATSAANAPTADAATVLPTPASLFVCSPPPRISIWFSKPLLTPTAREVLKHKIREELQRRQEKRLMTQQSQSQPQPQAAQQQPSTQQISISANTASAITPPTSASTEVLNNNEHISDHMNDHQGDNHNTSMIDQGPVDITHHNTNSIIGRKRDSSELDGNNNDDIQKDASVPVPATIIVSSDDPTDDHVIGPLLDEFGYPNLNSTPSSFGDFVQLGADTTLGYIADQLWERDRQLAETTVGSRGRKKKRKRFTLYYGVEGMRNEPAKIKPTSTPNNNTNMTTTTTTTAANNNNNNNNSNNYTATSIVDTNGNVRHIDTPITEPSVLPLSSAAVAALPIVPLPLLADETVAAGTAVPAMPVDIVVDINNIWEQ